MPKIIGFSQLRNEKRNGNLETWLTMMNELADAIYVFDNASDDGSQELYKQCDKLVVIDSEENRFKEELIIKNMLLAEIMGNEPDTDWILWLDGDTILEERLSRRGSVETLLGSVPMVNGIKMGHLNLWRSGIHYRIDNDFDYFDKFGRIPFWRFSDRLQFPSVQGLHKPQEPAGLNPLLDFMDYKLIHLGFSTDQQIIRRYNLYKSLGQEGNDLVRLVNEDTLQVKEITKEIIPWYYKPENTTNPIGRTKITEIMAMHEVYGDKV